jgi:hypothetical protein
MPDSPICVVVAATLGQSRISSMLHSMNMNGLCVWGPPCLKWSLAGGLVCILLTAPARAGSLGSPAQPTERVRIANTDEPSMSLISALQEDDNKRVAELLRAGADPNAADESGRTPLMWAAMRQSAENTKALLDAGADPLAQDADGHTASWHSTHRTVDFTVPLRRGMHGTIFLPRVFATRTQRLLAAATAAHERR